MDTERARGPWPWVVGGLLGTMISISLLFLAVALKYPDPPVVDDAYRAGLEYATGFERPYGTELDDGGAPPRGDEAP